MDDHFLCNSAFFACGYKEIDAFGAFFHLVSVGSTTGVVVGGEVVNEGTLHVVDPDIDLACEVVEVELHLSVVGVGHHGEVGGNAALFFDAVERTYHPELTLDTVFRGTAVVSITLQPNGVAQHVKHIHFAVLAYVAVGFEEPVMGVFKFPGDGVPMAVRVVVPEIEVVGVDLELRCCHDPVGGVIGLIHRIDGRGVRCVFKAHIHRDDAVAVFDVLIGPMIGARQVIDEAVVVAMDDFVALRIPEVFVARLVFGYEEVAFVVVVDAKAQVDDAVAAVAGEEGVVIDSFLTELLAEEAVRGTFANGRLDVGLLVGIHGDVDADIGVDDAVADVARVGGGA